MSSFEDFKQSLAPEQLELFEGRISSDREQYEKLTSLVGEVYSDENSRLPLIPAFHRYRTLPAEEHFLQTTIPRLLTVRGEQFCKAQCSKEGPSCYQPCRQFVDKAYSYGNSIFRALHKPYRLTKFESEAEE